MQINCPKCHASLDGDVPIGTSVICPACGHTFSIGDTTAKNPAQHSPVAKRSEATEPKITDAERFLRVVAYLVSILSLVCIGGIVVSITNNDKTGPFFFAAFVSCICSSLLLHAICHLLCYQRKQIGLLVEIAESVRQK